MARTNYLTAVRDAIAEEMRQNDSVFIMGEDIRQNLFGSTGGLVAEFGADRVLDVPLAEAGVVGTAVGAAMVGMRPIVDITMSPFLYPATDQIISIAAKSRYIYGGQTSVPMVIRSCMFYNTGSAAQHSDRPYSLFMGVPGLKIVLPTDAHDVKGLLKSAIRDDDPVLFFEDVNLWGAVSEIPNEDYVVPIGKAAVKREGRDVTVFAVGSMVPRALEAAETLAGDGVSVEVIDPRTIKPLDVDTVLQSVARTGRLVAVDAAHRTGSVASEVVSIVSERAFAELKAAPIRLCTPDTHIPFAASMEKALYPSVERIVGAVCAVMASSRKEIDA